MKSTTAGVLVILVAAAGAAWYFNARKPVEGHPSTFEEVPPPAQIAPAEPVVTHPVEAIETASGTVVEPAVEAPPLPDLAESDALAVETLEPLLGSDAIANLLLTEQVVHRIVATVDSLPSRKVAPLVLPLKPPPGKFMIDDDAGRITISEDNAGRYAAYADIASRLDAAQLAAIYVRLYPLFQQAYEELGYPDGYFNDRLVEVIDHLLDTPEPVTPPQLVKPEAVYLYADEDLEALSAGQKMLLRAGAEHRQVIREQLEALRAIVARQSPR